MKRRQDVATAVADVPLPKRMATDTAEGAAPAVNRFGFGFRGALATKTSSATETTSNQTENEGVSSKAIVESEPVIREGARRTSHRDRSLPRPNARKSAGQVKLDNGIAPPTGAQSNGRLAMKRNTAPTGIRRASDSVSVLQSPVSSRHSSSRTLSKTDEASLILGKENNDPLVRSTESAMETIISTHLSSDRLAEFEALLQLRLKAKKFDAKARQEELQSHNRQMKAAIRTVCDSMKACATECGSFAKKVQTELHGYETRARRFQSHIAEKDLQITRLNQELDGLRRESEVVDKRNRDLTAENKDLLETRQRMNCVRTELETTILKLQDQLQQYQKDNEELRLEVRAHKATMSDRVQLYEEKKKELEQFYQRRDVEEEKKKESEIDRLQTRLTEVREELAAANQEKETYKRRLTSAEDDFHKERDRSMQIEREKCTLEAQYQSLESRLSSHASEVAEIKAKLKQKEEECSNLIVSTTEIQKLTAASSSKVEDEKRELSKKVELLQSQLREAERKEANSAASLRELQAQTEQLVNSKSGWVLKEKEFQEQLKERELQLQESSRQLSVEVGVRQMLESQMRELRTEHVAVNAQMEAVRVEMKRLQSTYDEAKSKWQAQGTVVEDRFKQEMAILHKQIERFQEEKVSLESEVKTLRERAANVRDEDLEELCQVKREVEVLRLRLKETSTQGSQSIAQKDRLIDELQERVRQGEKLRRTMHNTIQELRGNVRVFARTRPFLPSDGIDSRDAESLVPVVSCEYDGQTMKLRRQAKTSGGSDQDTYAFTFDKVFPPSSGQDNVFEEVSEFVQSALDGYHVCLFSYGQTGSGKTHTMQGSGNGQMRGIIPRAIEKVLSEAEAQKEHGWQYTMQVSFLEIYNESLKDLLAGREDSNKVLSIKKDAKGGVHVPDLTLISVQQMEQVEVLMERASRARSVACTDMNAQSSRSHSVFTLHLQGVNESEGIILDGKLNLVDLAGSERASRSNVSGDRLKETQAINKSLSCLADVFTAIGNKSAHIPFRNSKLTYLLQSSLSGDGKTLMMVNVSPTQESASETLCSLRFAQQVNKCELGKPKRQIKSKKEM
ncbi:hypothetical protein Poli38472_008443 [Pythium oligandrum]|uniref:Kinesin motor domain-containing protein n=1 Tax=Pythium oligandrum TaxID=41045 RepID=A0A8K1C3J0_PYTOL|nr:hypothetical protein Poli38472_008443 [Pythium oligandrum]|eukprot:TMW55795.1 hypothetical protein Poli38472_008443 [Pythium oligandrum]